MLQKAYLNYLKQYYPQHIEHYYKRKEKKDYVVNEFSCLDENDYIEQIKTKDIIVRDFLKQYVNDIIAKEPFPLFNKIEIETINQCNNTCSFCPVNVFADIRVHKTMSMELFIKIISELKNTKYAGAINLFSNNEPLLDPFLLERLKYARINLPDAYIFIYTNGILLTPEKLLDLLPYTDYIHINNYHSKPELLNGHKKLQQVLMENNISEDKVEIHLRNKNECLSTRAGQAPNRIKKSNLESICILPFSQIVIRPDGNISFCCNDAYGQFSLGNVSTESLKDIWYGEKFEKNRINMLKGRLCQIPCDKCDMLFMPLACEKNNTKVDKL